MVSICFRFDDASAKSDHKLEHKVFDVFARLNVPLCVAVIPFAGPTGKPDPLSSQNAAHLFEAARAGIIEIALHGHSHLQLRALFPLDPHSRLVLLTARHHLSPA